MLLQIKTFVILLLTVLTTPSLLTPVIDNITQNIHKSFNSKLTNFGPPFYSVNVKSGCYAAINQNKLGQKTFILQINMDSKPDIAILIANSTNQIKKETEQSCFSIYAGRYKSTLPNKDVYLQGVYYHFAFLEEDADTKCIVTKINNDTIYIIKYFLPINFNENGCERKESRLELWILTGYRPENNSECPDSHRVKINIPVSGNFCIDAYSAGDHNIYDKLEEMNITVYNIPQDNSENSTGDDLNWIGIVVGVVLPVIIIIIIIVVVKKLKMNRSSYTKDKKRSEHDDKEDENKEEAETIPLNKNENGTKDVTEWMKSLGGQQSSSNVTEVDFKPTVRGSELIECIDPNREYSETDMKELHQKSLSRSESKNPVHIQHVPK